MSVTSPSRLPGPERRQQIIEAARKVFLSSGLSGARVREIAKTADVNEALLYHYFTSKEELFDVAVVEPLREMIRDLMGAEAQMASESPADRVKLVTDGMLHMVTTISELLPLLGMMLFSDQEAGARFYNESFYPAMSQTYAAAEPAVSGWLDWPLDPITTPAVFGMCFGVAMDHWFRGVASDPTVVAEKLSDLLLYGVPKSQQPRNGQNLTAPRKRSARASRSAVKRKS